MKIEEHIRFDVEYVFSNLFQLVLSVAMNGHSIQSSAAMNLLPSASSIVSLADSQDRATFATIMKMKEEPMDVVVDSNKEEDEIDMELGVTSDEALPKESPKKDSQDPKQNLFTLLQRQAKFLESCREVKVNISVVFEHVLFLF